MSDKINLRSEEKSQLIEATRPVYKIEKRIPLPGKHAFLREKYPLRYMHPGDSFLIPAKNGKAKIIRSSVYNQVWADKKKKKIHAAFKCTTRILKDGLRVWRIK